MTVLELQRSGQGSIPWVCLRTMTNSNTEADDAKIQKIRHAIEFLDYAREEKDHETGREWRYVARAALMIEESERRHAAVQTAYEHLEIATDMKEENPWSRIHRARNELAEQLRELGGEEW